jgi:hypothetical protein
MSLVAASEPFRRAGRLFGWERFQWKDAGREKPEARLKNAPRPIKLTSDFRFPLNAL